MKTNAVLIIISTILFISCNNDDNLEIVNSDDTILNSDYTIKPSGYFRIQKEQQQDEKEYETSIYDTISNFKRIILRKFSNDEEEELIKIAESIYPRRISIRNQKTLVNNKDSLWWFNYFDGIKVPYAITGSAVKYYSDLINFYESEDFESAETIKNISAEFKYEAEVNYYSEYETLQNESFKNVYVVNLNLKWFSYCGSLCALWIDAKRTVIIDKINKSIYVFGDEHLPIVVS